MSLPAPGANSSKLPWGLAAIAMAVFFAAGTGLIYYHAESQEMKPTVPMFAHAETMEMPMPIDFPHARRGDSDRMSYMIHSVQLEEYQGKTVVRIQLTPDGDYVLLEASTGKFVERQEPTMVVKPAPQANIM